MGYRYYTEMIKPMISIMIVEVFIDMFFKKQMDISLNKILNAFKSVS